MNRMLAAESYKIRLETGLNFIEFNYMLLQAYDFYYLAEKLDCCLQMGGDDQWGNIVAGIELIRRKLRRGAHAVTFPLLTTASGAKMGKTAAGAVWLSAEKTSPFDFYQYWINTDDRDVARFLRLYTFLPVDEIEAVSGLEGQDLNACKTILAFEVTKLAHGREAALEALEAERSVFLGKGGFRPICFLRATYQERGKRPMLFRPQSSGLNAFRMEFLPLNFLPKSISATPGAPRGA